jgi:hypothetical protein
MDVLRVGAGAGSAGATSAGPIGDGAGRASGATRPPALTTPVGWVVAAGVGTTGAVGVAAAFELGVSGAVEGTYRSGSIHAVKRPTRV